VIERFVQDHSYIAVGVILLLLSAVTSLLAAIGRWLFGKLKALETRIGTLEERMATLIPAIESLGQTAERLRKAVDESREAVQESRETTSNLQGLVQGMTFRNREDIKELQAVRLEHDRQLQEHETTIVRLQRIANG
jgi:chromosome segregation ATPase